MNLPKRTGTEVLEAMRDSVLFARVPVLMWSSSTTTRDQASMMVLGSTQYLTKPSNLEGFMRIGELVKGILLAGRAPKGG